MAAVSETSAINMDMSKHCIVDTSKIEWIPSPLPGVERRCIEREGGEFARRATTIVRYAPNSRFSEHTHDAGEEYYVLEGVFSDASGDHGPGSYVRNPTGSRHAPWSDDGCVIFVKLRQMPPDGEPHININTKKNPVFTSVRSSTGKVEVMNLFESSVTEEKVRLIRLHPGTEYSEGALKKGYEILVLEGAVVEEQYLSPARSQLCCAGYWMRAPPGSILSLRTTNEEGTLLLIKTGHLPNVL